MVRVCVNGEKERGSDRGTANGDAGMCCTDTSMPGFDAQHWWYSTVPTGSCCLAGAGSRPEDVKATSLSLADGVELPPGLGYTLCGQIATFYVQPVDLSRMRCMGFGLMGLMQCIDGSIAMITNQNASVATDGLNPS